MKYHFKHQFGYINVDDAKLYFTSSGNWKEVENLQPFQHNTIKSTMPKEVYTIGLLCLIPFGIVAFFFLPRLLEEIAFGFVGFLGLSGYQWFLRRYSIEHSFILREQLLDIISINPFETKILFEDQEGKLVQKLLLMSALESKELLNSLQHINPMKQYESAVELGVANFESIYQKIKIR